MRYFYKLAEGVDVRPLMHSMARQPFLWNENPFRTTYQGTPHVDVDDILVRFSSKEVCDSGPLDVMNDDKVIWYPAFQKLPEIKPLLRDLMATTGGYSIERVIISRIRPGGEILAHADTQGEYVNEGDIARYHIVLQGLPGSLFHCGDETVNMKTGEVWWFNPFEMHSVQNNSTDDRIHMLCDFRYMT